MQSTQTQIASAISIGLCLAFLVQSVSAEEMDPGSRRVEVLVIGNAVPDYSFFLYDPSLRYRMIEYPTWADRWTREEAGRWSNLQKASGNLLPADFIIELPYNRYGNPIMDTTIRGVCEASIGSRGASILLPVPQTPILADFAPDHTRVELEEGGFPTKLTKQNWDVLRGRLSTQFSLSEMSSPFNPFGGLVPQYHDANLFIMEDLHPSAETIAVINPSGSLAKELDGSRPWLVRMHLSDVPSGRRLSAKGYVWKCASPLTGVFFFPQGGLVATHVVLGAGYVHIDNLKIEESHEYAWDMISHIILSSVGREIPELEPAHRARNMFAGYYQLYADAYRALELADQISSTSQTYPVWVDLGQIVNDKGSAEETYLSGDVEGSVGVMEDVLHRIEKAKLGAERALRLSLFVTNLVQYAAVGGTLLFSLSVTLHFVYRPRIRLVGTTRSVAPEGLVRTRPRLVQPSVRWRMAMGAILVIVLTTPVLALLWDQISEMVSWDVVYSDENWYGYMAEEQMVYTGRLVAKDPEGCRVFVDRLKGVAWLAKPGEMQPPDTVTTYFFWLFELRRPGEPPLFVFAENKDDEELRILNSYIGLEVEIRGRVRRPVVYLGEEFETHDLYELVPGAIRQTGVKVGGRTP